MRGGGFKDFPENINRNGRPKKGETFTDIISMELSKQNVLLKTETGNVLIEAKKAVVRKLISLAVDGNLYAIRYLMDRVDGSPRQMITIAGSGSESLSAEAREELIKSYERELMELEKVRNTEGA